MVAGLVGEGLTGIFIESGMETWQIRSVEGVALTSLTVIY